MRRSRFIWRRLGKGQLILTQLVAVLLVGTDEKAGLTGEGGAQKDEAAVCKFNDPSWVLLFLLQYASSLLLLVESLSHS
jgi:hypothetical protein